MFIAFHARFISDIKMLSHVINLANSIIGVSVLAMPYCFKQCGIILAFTILFMSSILSRLACHFLIKSAVMCRRKNFEFLAFYAFGPMGKFIGELFVIGFLLGTCIAFFVVVGDLGPQIIGGILSKEPEVIRTNFLIFTAIFIVLPLGLLRNIDSLTSVNTISIGFYACLVLKVIGESIPHIFTKDWIIEINFWRPAGILQCLPIFSMALFCQTQLFEIYQVVPNPSLEKMNNIVKGALNICTIVYLSVGFFGYIAYYSQPFTGNILLSFEPTYTSEIIKIGFVLSVAFSFPIVIFPCRASLYSLFFKRGHVYESSSSYIPETKFRCITVIIIGISLAIGISIPNIEFVLGIVGSTIGIMICLIFPAGCFISISMKNNNEKLIAQSLIFIGSCIMILGTYANLYAMEQSSNNNVEPIINKLNNLGDLSNGKEIVNQPIEMQQEMENSHILLQLTEPSKEKLTNSDKFDDNSRQEPPVPVETLNKIKKKPPKLKNRSKELINQERENEINQQGNEILNDDKLKYELSEKNNEENSKLSIDKDKVKSSIQQITKKLSETNGTSNHLEKDDDKKRREELEKTLEKHLKEQKGLVQEQKEIWKDIKKHETILKLGQDSMENQNLNDQQSVNELGNRNVIKPQDILQLDMREAKVDSKLDMKIDTNVHKNEISKKVEEINVSMSNSSVISANKLFSNDTLIQPQNGTPFSKSIVKVEKTSEDVIDKNESLLANNKLLNAQFSQPIALKMNKSKISMTQTVKMSNDSEKNLIREEDTFKNHKVEKRMIQNVDFEYQKNDLNSENRLEDIYQTEVSQKNCLSKGDNSGIEKKDTNNLNKREVDDLPKKILENVVIDTKMGMKNDITI